MIVADIIIVCYSPLVALWDNLSWFIMVLGRFNEELLRIAYIGSYEVWLNSTIGVLVLSFIVFGEELIEILVLSYSLH